MVSTRRSKKRPIPAPGGGRRQSSRNSIRPKPRSLPRSRPVQGEIEPPTVYSQNRKLALRTKSRESPISQSDQKLSRSKPHAEPSPVFDLETPLGGLVTTYAEKEVKVSETWEYRLESGGDGGVIIASSQTDALTHELMGSLGDLVMIKDRIERIEAWRLNTTGHSGIGDSGDSEDGNEKTEPSSTSKSLRRSPRKRKASVQQDIQRPNKKTSPGPRIAMRPDHDVSAYHKEFAMPPLENSLISPEMPSANGSRETGSSTL